MNQAQRFVVIDGPNGAGKSFVVAHVCSALEAQGMAVLGTQEPTKAFNRANEEKHGETLAQLILEDRQLHLKSEVEPALSAGKIVISDRYIASSLVYRKLDGIPFEHTWDANKKFLQPDTYVLLTASPTQLRERMGERKNKTRFEREYQVEDELRVYRAAHDFLRRQGERVVVVENNSDSETLIAALLSHIL